LRGAKRRSNLKNEFFRQRRLLALPTGRQAVGRDPSEKKVKTLIISSHCESRPFVNDYIRKQIIFFNRTKFCFFKLKFVLTKGRDEAISLNEL